MSGQENIKKARTAAASLDASFGNLAKNQKEATNAKASEVILITGESTSKPQILAKPLGRLAPAPAEQSLDSDSSPTCSVVNSSDDEYKVANEGGKGKQGKGKARTSARRTAETIWNTGLVEVSFKKATKKVDSSSEDRPGAVEIFCGCAKLTASLSKAGFNALGVDYEKNKDRPIGKCINIDLNTKWGPRELKRKLLELKAKLAWLAPPCGSASAARKIRRTYGPDPQPLRSVEFPDGLPGLEEPEAGRVKIANALYEAAVDICLFCDEVGIEWVVENPTNSLLWQTSPFIRLVATLKDRGRAPRRADMQMCMHGGQRDKKTTLMYASVGTSLEALCVMCDKNHTHLPWGMTKIPGTLWATADERNYPQEFCDKIAKMYATSHCVLQRKKVESPPRGKRHKAQVKPQLEKQWAGQQPRRGQSDLVQEYKKILVFHGATGAELKKTKEGKGDRIIKCGSIEIKAAGDLLDVVDEGVSGSSYRGTIGVCWTPLEFIEEGKKCVHPMDTEIKVPQRVAQVLDEFSGDLF